MFSNLDDFLNESIHMPKNDSPVMNLSSNNETSSQDFDLSLELPGPSRSLRSNTTVEDKLEDNPKPEYKPAKGQKTAVKRFNKIKELLAKDETPVAAPPPPPKAKKSVTQRNNRRNRNAVPTRRYWREIEGYSDDENENENYDDCDSILNSMMSRSRNAPHTIVLDADDDFVGPDVNIKRNLGGASTCLTEDNDEIKVKVKINGQIEDYLMRPYQKLSELIDQIVGRRSLSSDSIVLLFQDKCISKAESPRSIGYIQGLIIYAHISDLATQTSKGSSAQVNKDKIEIKIQSAQRKRPFIIYIRKTEQLNVLAMECAEEFKCDPKKIRLEFDGDMIDFNETADDLQLEGGEVMDLFLAK